MKINSKSVNRSILALLFGSLVIYIFLRAYYLSFTHDESLSFKILLGNLNYKNTANHHLLNTFLMNVCYKIFGGKEIYLRLPNILAFVLYSVFCFKILIRTKNFLLALTGFSLLVLNPYLLDFFSLARGYGLSIGFGLASFYFLFRQDENTSFKRYITNLSLSLGLSLLSAFSCLVSIDLDISILVVYSIELYFLMKDKKVYLDRKRIILLTLIFLANMAGIVYLVERVLMLGNNHELYIGGSRNFIDDTLASLIRLSLYFSKYGGLFVILVKQILVFAFAIGILYQFRYRRYSHLSKISIVLVCMIISMIMQHYLLGSLYPVERTALIFIPFMALYLLSFFNDVNFLLRPFLQKIFLLIVSLFVCFPLLYHFISTINLTSTLDWKYDANTKQVMNEIDQRHRDGNKNNRIAISNDWVFEPSINYYRVINSMEYMEPANREPVRKDADFIYCFSDSILPNDSLKIIARFENTKTVLIENKSATHHH